MDARYPASEAFAEQAIVGSLSEYQALYDRSVQDPDGFWGEMAGRIDWIKPFTKVQDVSFDKDDLHIRWFEDGITNASYNAIDRHLDTRGDQTAMIFEPDSPDEPARHITYRDLYDNVNRLANVLKSKGVKKGDRVTIYLPMIPEAAFSMLACARIGAIHSVVFGGFSPESLANRIVNCDSTVLITADESMRSGKFVPLKANADRALAQCPDVDTVLVARRSGRDVAMQAGRDYWMDDEMAAAQAECAVEPMNAEDPLFILYTSGSTGKPKGLLHTTGGYLVYAAMTHEYVFDYQDGDVFWCTADVGWITGHSYIVYGPLLNGATQVFFEGVPTYPDASRFWQVVDKHKVTQFYTAPTAIRALMQQGDSFVEGTSRDSLRLLGTVGEPINPEAWRWYHEVIGKSRCPIVDTWWQTETGGILITPLPGAIDTKPGSATKPFFGVEPEILDNEGNTLEGAVEGVLVMKNSWPGQARTIYGDHERYIQTYFSTFDGKYFTGDGCKRDEDGYYWITGRVDDVINVSGHRMGTAEVESALVAHSTVAEAAVVGFPHDVKGQGIYCYVTLNSGIDSSAELSQELVKHVRTVIGPIAKPDMIQFTPSLPKTRSGKIMRRILRKIAANDYANLGDTSTLADATVVDDLIENRQNR
ncbi:MAG: acetate--CoA ligase [Bacteroidetes Order II. Incertae sedis bacterium]|jgi:acetyl-CoA synthetase|nr:acetate--CoA ligase [Bacteroidetes Order II. bacterium]MBT5248856.1 acetate--CoA ligase [Bacteroidetes Order II. bacterium]MBT6199192.1 acetate--CoA ligase [Bacteroidetes Order II. bacterium]MBT6424944.1 acetate--CoA ligase [Bacteroidetes Order II. bacterium]MBT6580552.1 acetate--CoA ligase [Bacteroidetes Order II. bacterium]